LNPLESKERSQSPGEEIANSISHGIGLAAAVAAFPVLIVFASRRGDAAGIVGAAIFATSMVLLYLASTLYHAFTGSRLKQAFRILDHSAIYLLIAGTYTPFTLGVLRGGWGWSLFGIVWGIATVGIVLKAAGGIRYNTLSTFAYLGMGWLIIIAAGPMWRLMPGWGIFWLFMGGLAYTGGVPFYLMENKRYFHFVWHIFILAGTSCHFVAVLLYSA
jgi:hemolysin III